MVVLIDENVNGQQTYTFSVSNDVTSIKIKNAEKFPFLTVSMNGIVINKNQLSVNNIGDYKVILLLQNKDNSVEYPIDF